MLEDFFAIKLNSDLFTLEALPSVIDSILPFS